MPLVPTPANRGQILTKQSNWKSTERERRRTCPNNKLRATWALAVNICLKVFVAVEVRSTVSYCWLMKNSCRQINTCTQICKHITKHAHTARLQFHFLASCTRQKQTITKKAYTQKERKERLATDSPSRHLNNIQVGLGKLPLKPLTLQEEERMLLLCSLCFHKLNLQ